MKIQVLSQRTEIIENAVAVIVRKINDHPKNNIFVLGLSTGATVLSMCEALVTFVQKGEVSLKNVVIFYAGEYIGFSKKTKQYYFNLLQEIFISKVDIDPNNIFTLDGNVEDPVKECDLYEEKINSYGGMDLFVGSLGTTGALAFNEPGSSLQSRTRLKTLTSETLKADARFFGDNISLVPHQAVTMGVGTIFDAKMVLIVVYGVQKAFALKACLEESVSEMNPASIFQLHGNTVFLADKVAGRLLSKAISINHYEN